MKGGLASPRDTKVLLYRWNGSHPKSDPKMSRNPEDVDSEPVVNSSSQRECLPSSPTIVFVVFGSLNYVQLFATPWTNIALQAFLSMGFSRQEYWSG